jgi:hypothetical protein
MFSTTHRAALYYHRNALYYPQGHPLLLMGMPSTTHKDALYYSQGCPLVSTGVPFTTIGLPSTIIGMPSSTLRNTFKYPQGRVPKVYQKCGKSAPKVYQKVYQKCTKSVPTGWPSHLGQFQGCHNLI